MVDREVFARRLAKLEECVRDLRALSARERDEVLRNPGLRAQLERWLHLAAESVLDLAHHLIADRGWRTPATYRETFQILREHGVIDGALASQLEGWAGLRNVLVHLYLEVDHHLLWQFARQDLDQLEAFALALDRVARS